MKTTAKQREAIAAGARFVPVCEWQYSADAIEAANEIPRGVVSEQSHALGMRNGEPLIVAMDALLQYAYTYKSRFGGPLASDYVLGPEWLAALRGVKGLLDGDGAEAMRLGRTTDSKDNGALEKMFWCALEAAGFTEKDLT